MTQALDDILMAVASGRADGVEACVRRFSGPIWHLARRYTPSDQDAEDAMQDILVDVWRSAGRFDPEAGSAMTFVMTLARRRLIDGSRRRGRRPTTQSLTESVEVSDAKAPDPLEIEDELERVSVALDRLRPDQRHVLELALVHGRSHQQIAESTGLALGTVKSHARRGLMRVREMLGVGRDEEEGS